MVEETHASSFDCARRCRWTILNVSYQMRLASYGTSHIIEDLRVGCFQKVETGYCAEEEFSALCALSNQESFDTLLFRQQRGKWLESAYARLSRRKARYASFTLVSWIRLHWEETELHGWVEGRSRTSLCSHESPISQVLLYSRAISSLSLRVQNSAFALGACSPAPSTSLGLPPWPVQRC